MLFSKEEPKNKRYSEVGATGLKQFSGYVQEEFLRDLKGKDGIKTYKEMSDNDPTVGSILFATEMLLRGVTWTVEPASADPADEAAAEFVNSCRDDMSHSWTDFISEVTSMLSYGWAYHETVYKRRMGPNQKDGSRRSKYDDGMIGWRKLPIRSQDSLLRWIFDDEDESLRGMEQQTVTGHRAFIPIEKSLLFRTTTKKNNPEGRSILRSAYKPYYYKKRIENYEAIGIERDLAGLPVIGVDAELMVKAAESTDEGVAAKAALDQYKSIGQNIRNDEQACVIMPIAYDDDGNKMFTIDLMSSGGSRQFDTNAIINRYDSRIAQTILADFILIGQGTVGTQALAEVKIDLFMNSLTTWLNVIEDTFNRFAIPRLMHVNGIDQTRSPKLTAGPVKKQDVEKLITSIESMVNATVLEVDDKLTDTVKQSLEIE